MTTDAERAKRFAKARTERLKAGIDLQRDTAGEVKKQLAKAERDIKNMLAAAPSDYKQWQLGQLQQSVKRALIAIEPASDHAMQSGLNAAWSAGRNLIDSPLAAAGLDISADLVGIDTRKLLAMRAFTTDRVRDVTAKLVNRINSELALTVIGTQTPFEATTRVASILQTGGVKRAGMLVRTQLGQAFSVAAQERKVQAAVIVPGLQKQWRRSGKLHSRYEHDAIDGQIRDVDKPFNLPNRVALMHPRDPDAPVGEIINCGCSSIPYMSSWQVARPGRLPVTEEERSGSRGKRLIADAF